MNTGLDKSMFWKVRDLNCFLQTNNSLATDFLKQESGRQKQELGLRMKWQLKTGITNYIL